MNENIDLIRKFRLNLLRQIEGLNTEQLNTIPAGYNNNIIWNMAHMIAVQQSLSYVRAEQPVAVDDRYFTPFLPGTRPERALDEHEIVEVREVFISSLDRLQEDYDKGYFGNYTPSAGIRKIYGITLRTIDQGIAYTLFHDGFHAGYIASMKHLV